MRRRSPVKLYDPTAKIGRGKGPFCLERDFLEPDLCWLAAVALVRPKVERTNRPLKNGTGATSIRRTPRDTAVARCLSQFFNTLSELKNRGTLALRIIHYPHPTLRHVSKPLRRVDAELHGIVREMFDLMYVAKGIGLAANQVDLPYRLFVLNLESDPTTPENEFVFINPVLRSPHGMVEAEEGCLSLPGLYGDVRRPERVVLNAFTLVWRGSHDAARWVVRPRGAA